MAQSLSTRDLLFLHFFCPVTPSDLCLKDFHTIAVDFFTFYHLKHVMADEKEELHEEKMATKTQGSNGEAIVSYCIIPYDL